MSEYELSLMRQRGLAARDSKARRGEFRLMLPPGFCWSEAGRIDIDPDEHVQEAVRMVFAKFQELGSARQVFLWFRAAEIKMPVVRRNIDVYKIIWKSPPITPSCRSCTTPCTRGPTRLAGERSARGSLTDAPTRSTA